MDTKTSDCITFADPPRGVPHDSIDEEGPCGRKSCGDVPEVDDKPVEEPPVEDSLVGETPIVEHSVRCSVELNTEIPQDVNIDSSIDTPTRTSGEFPIESSHPAEAVQEEDHVKSSAEEEEDTEKVYDKEEVPVDEYPTESPTELHEEGISEFVTNAAVESPGEEAPIGESKTGEVSEDESLIDDTEDSFNVKIRNVEQAEVSSPVQSPTVEQDSNIVDNNGVLVSTVEEEDDSSNKKEKRRVARGKFLSVIKKKFKKMGTLFKLKKHTNDSKHAIKRSASHPALAPTQSDVNEFKVEYSKTTTTRPLSMAASDAFSIPSPNVKVDTQSNTAENEIVAPLTPELANVPKDDDEEVLQNYSPEQKCETPVEEKTPSEEKFPLDGELSFEETTPYEEDAHVNNEPKLEENPSDEKLPSPEEEKTQADESLTNEEDEKNALFAQHPAMSVDTQSSEAKNEIDGPLTPDSVKGSKEEEEDQQEHISEQIDSMTPVEGKSPFGEEIIPPEEEDTHVENEPTPEEKSPVEEDIPVKSDPTVIDSTPSHVENEITPDVVQMNEVKKNVVTEMDTKQKRPKGLVFSHAMVSNKFTVFLN